MSKKLKQALAKKIISITDENLDDEALIHTLLEEEIFSLNDIENATFGQKAADLLAHFAGSWVFIIIFVCVLISWIVVNAYFLSPPFDAYPFILLNLVLSCIAAIQAPLIMMSQNRQEHKDRRRAESDYRVNLKSEIIIEDIHYKLDKIIAQQDNMHNMLSKNENTIEKPE